jgi:hypothetical protein
MEIGRLAEAGPRDGKRILSYAVFQMRPDDERALGLYHRSVPAVLRACLTLFPSWTVVIHHDDSLMAHPYGAVLKRAEEAGMLKLRSLGHPGELCRGMLWRMRPIWFEEGAEIVACRDIDALPMVRDRVTLEAFVASGAWAHCLLDNVAHAGLMGGLSAYRVDKIRERWPSWDQFVASDSVVWSAHGADQNFLNRVIGPYVGDHMLVHQLAGKPTSSLPLESIKDVPRLALSEADNFAAYAGVSGFNVENPCAFYDTLPETRPLREIEAAIGWMATQ